MQPGLTCAKAASRFLCVPHASCRRLRWDKMFNCCSASVISGSPRVQCPWRPSDRASSRAASKIGIASTVCIAAAFCNSARIRIFAAAVDGPPTRGDPKGEPHRLPAPPIVSPCWSPGDRPGLRMAGLSGGGKESGWCPVAPEYISASGKPRSTRACLQNAALLYPSACSQYCSMASGTLGTSANMTAGTLKICQTLNKSSMTPTNARSSAGSARGSSMESGPVYCLGFHSMFRRMSILPRSVRNDTKPFCRMTCTCSSSEPSTTSVCCPRSFAAKLANSKLAGASGVANCTETETLPWGTPASATSCLSRSPWFEASICSHASRSGE
mmetsp:Transcript_22849/g.65955  ORF Transcript_22849/g.65955 Transcript_22849/m.65955 type:complete len:328 (+) Transcript_22849:205-1188(+)